MNGCNCSTTPRMRSGNLVWHGLLRVAEASGLWCPPRCGTASLEAVKGAPALVDEQPVPHRSVLRTGRARLRPSRGARWAHTFGSPGGLPSQRAQFAAVLVLLLLCLAQCAWSAEDEFQGLRFSQQPDRSIIAGGLAWQAAIEKDGIRLGRRAHICFEEGGYGLESWCTYAGSDWADIGLVRPGSASLTLQDTSSTWATAHASFTYNENGQPQTLRVWVTRLSPAVVFEVTGQTLRLFNSARAFRYAKSDANSVPTEQRLSGPAPVPAHSYRPESGSWMLAWYGAGSRIRAEADIGNRTIATDCPVLIVFSVPPTNVATGADGLTLTFPAAGPKRIAIMPLLGERLPRAIAAEKPKPYPAFIGASRANHAFPFAELPATETWKDNLPQEVLGKCQWWAQRLAEVPIEVKETHSYDVPNDIVNVRGQFQFLKLSEGGKRFAPLPPMLAVAARQKFSMLSIDATPLDSGLMTKWGPYFGIDGGDGYAWSVKGLARYAFEQRTTATGAEPPEVRQAFDREIAKVTDAGILAPWFPILAVGGFGARASRANDEGHRLLWGIPGENLYYIGQCLDLASPDQRNKLVELAKAWEAKYPSQKVPHMPAARDALREHYLPTIYRLRAFPVQDQNFHYLNNVLPCEAEYYLADYYHYTGQKPAALPTALDPYLARADWASLGLLRGAKTLFKTNGRDAFDRDYGKGGVDDLNRLFAGLVGRARLAQSLNDSAAVERAMYHLARTATLRFALEQWKYVLHADKYLALRPPDAPPRTFYGTGLHTFNRTTPDDDPLVVAEMDEFLVTMRECYVHVHWHPHRLIAFLNLTPELGRFLQDHLKTPAANYVRIVEESNPEWYTPYADCTLAFETYSLHPADSYQTFLARAWITGDAPEKLWKYADLPWVGRGDWFYIHKLAETIRAYRGVNWEKMK